MKLYHYTGIHDLNKALVRESLRADLYDGAVRSAQQSNVPVEEAYSSLYRHFSEELNPALFDHRTHINFLTDMSDPYDSRHSFEEFLDGTMVIMGFDVPEGISQGDGRRQKISDKVSLDYLAEVHAQENIFDSVQKRIDESGNKIPVYKMQPVNMESWQFWRPGTGKPIWHRITEGIGIGILAGIAFFYFNISLDKISNGFMKEDPLLEYTSGVVADFHRARQKDREDLNIYLSVAAAIGTTLIQSPRYIRRK